MHMEVLALAGASAPSHAVIDGIDLAPMLFMPHHNGDAHTYAYVHICIHIRIHRHMRIHMHTCIYTSIHT